MMLVRIPMALPSVANLREHWSKRARRTKQHRLAARLFLTAHLRVSGERVCPPCVVTFTRIAPRKLDDDNLASACKGTRDGIADALGIDDGDERVTWRYGQRKGKAKEYAIDVQIVPADLDVARAGRQVDDETLPV